MRIVRSATGWTTALAVLFAAAPLQAQYSTKMPSTLRWGSGHVDVPSASVLPHMAITGTYSGFLVNIDDNLIIGGNGRIIGRSGRLKKWYSDASVAFGLFDRAEVGAIVHSLDDNGSGNLIGGFGQLALLRPADNGAGIGLSIGTRYSTSPKYDESINYAPNRLGIPDPNFRQGYGPGTADTDTNLSSYAVASAFLRGGESDLIPDHDFTFSVGWGNGVFQGGDYLPWYSYADSEGFFGGATLHLKMSDRTLLNLSGDWNGFDTNLGAQLDFHHWRLGLHYLGTNYFDDFSMYRSPKFGALASLALCPGRESLLCHAQLIERPVADTIRLPAPAPDTITITREVAAPLPTGQATSICLATGETIQVLVTAQGDTLVGPARTSIRLLRQAGVVFAGEYAQGRTWFDQDQPITFEERPYQKSGGEIRLNCPDLVRVGEYQGVPLFAMRNATQPYTQLYVPVRPGVWQMYENLRATRG
ncbi:MAG: hypothetical protein EXR95_03760 [Gemmatimonadetes bacterium]|nr:hypothetical protein [Gemmatimonadota bacterium]